MKRIFYYLTIFSLSAGILGLAAVFIIFQIYSKDLPNFSSIADYRPKLVTTVYARDNSIIGYFYDEKRFLVNLEQIPDHLERAFLAAEDDNFYSHHGIDFLAILKAMVSNIQAGEIVRGGSTITQQLVKQLALSGEKKYERKIKEAILAYRLSYLMTKEEVLNIYLNHIYLGNNSYGVEAAARTYFAKHVDQLTLAESAILAGLPKAPSDFNPFKNPERIKQRQIYTLDRMLLLKWITQAEHDAAINEPLVYKSMPEPSWQLGAWYLEEVRRSMIEFFSEENVKRLGLKIDRYGKAAVQEAGLHIYTAMDPVHQKAGEIALRKGLHETSKRHGWVGPILNLAEKDWEDYLSKENFNPTQLENAGWVKALVTKTAPKFAEVRMGNYNGIIEMAQMQWCRNRNPKYNDPTKILTVGDVVWVSVVGASGTSNPVSAPAGGKIPVFEAKNVEPTTVIKLALEQFPEVEGALSSIESKEGDLVALVGGYSFSYNSQFNRATQAIRQPGSSFKPVVYSAALDSGFTAGSLVNDAPIVISGPNPWRPGNADGAFLGRMLMATALAKSRNLCTIQIAQKIGMDKVVARAAGLGLETTPIPQELAIALGAYAVSPLRLTEAYTAFANQGKKISHRLVTRIDDSWGQPMIVVPSESTQVISPQNAYVMSFMLREVVNAGTGGRAKALGRPVGGKTGTTNDEKDAWFMGVSPYLTTGVYVGYDKIKPMGRGEGGSRVALPIFVDYRKSIDSLYPPEDFPVPEGITTARIDADTGLLAGPGTQRSYSLPFIKGTEPTIASGVELQKGQDDNMAVEGLYQNMDLLED
ncbi:penicillin-binding protein 1A [Desulfovibrio litoralis]|uniref:Penicillin-binding protein 1A n=1 Tax=Desulfovibrio litoralis DSM 11393 TaxID=1121455 RepID=A0A1M7THX0_9BACT|nr:PBP1A family penicillin-binding protein [Desulfovibrio litoralis]SHN70315.1 penicillin-binding protein 1A [Desulfovibrio litoralis DSM 11393]